jgi:DNA-binding transcriptional MerR regulator
MMASPKAPEAFRTISEVASDLDLPQHVLRFWETRFTQIKPMKRGGGRRYYRPEDVDLLRGIRLLLYGEGFTIRGVQRLLKEKGVGFVTSVGQTGSVTTVAAPEAEDESAPQPRARVRVAPEVNPPEPAIDKAPAPPAPAPEPKTVYALAPEKRRRAEAALEELEEAKRLLEQAR